MIIIFFILALGVILFIGAVTAVVIRINVLKECEQILKHYNEGLILPIKARLALLELKKKMVVKQHKDEVQDYINLIVD